jgi:ribonuclease-3
MLKLPNFRNTLLLRLALTHRSYRNEFGELEDNQRLEFLGKAVLSFASSAFLYKVYPEMEEDELSRRRSALVDEKQLAKFAIELGIDQQMQVGTAVLEEGGYQNAGLLSSTFAAIVGAYFLDSGLDAVRAFVKPLFGSVIEKLPRSQSNPDSKGLFQLWSLLNFGQKPEYFILEELEPNQTKTRQFTAGACVDGEVYGVGTEYSRPAAEKLAAEAALKKLGLAF